MGAPVVALDKHNKSAITATVVVIVGVTALIRMVKIRQVIKIVHDKVDGGEACKRKVTLITLVKK